MLRIPVKLDDDQWETLYGEPLPVANGAIGELRIDSYAITDKNFLAAVTEKRRVRILDAGTALCVAINPDSDLAKGLEIAFELYGSIKYDQTAKINPYSRFVRVHLFIPTEQQSRRKEHSGGLWLKLEGMTDRGVESSTILLPIVPGLKKQTATSLNHALTMLSELLETQRISHTGNIYEQVLYEDSDKIWYPLKDLRDRELAIAERQIIKGLWDSVKSQMPSILFGK